MAEVITTGQAVAYLISADTTKPDTPFCTYSGWFNIPSAVFSAVTSSASGTVFGPFSFGNLDNHCFLSVVNVGGLKWSFDFLCVAPAIFQGRCRSNTLSLGTILPDTWNHFATSVRTNGDNYANRCWFYLNRVNVNDPNPGAGMGGIVAPLPQVGVFTDWINSIQFYGWGALYDQEIIDGQHPQMEPFNMEVSGLPYRIPSESTGIRVSACDFWFGQYIDLSSPGNLDIFITSDGAPAQRSLASAALGTPTYSNWRDSVSGVKFQDNLGDGGDFTVVGTDPQDYSPGPTFAGQS